MPDLSIIQEASGCAHTVLLLSDGTVWTAGPSGSAQPVAGLHDVTAIGAGSVHSLALTREGTVWAWGVPGSNGAPMRIPDESALYAPLAMPRQRRLHFGSQRPGQAAQVLTLVVTNLGLEPLRVSGAELTGEHCGDFHLVSDSYSGVEIYPGSSCSLDFAFRPAGPGWRRAEATILDNGLSRPVTVELTGYGAGVELQGDCPERLRVRLCDLVPIQLEASGDTCTPRVTCGRREWLETAGCERLLRQEFLIELPVTVDVSAACGCDSADLRVQTRFLAAQSIWVDLPVSFDAGLDGGTCPDPFEEEAECCFTVRQHLRVALPVEVSAAAQCEGFSMNCAGVC